VVRKSRVLSIASALALMLGVSVAVAPVAGAAEVCGAFDTVDVNNRQYVVMNNVWGASTPQCVDVNESTGAFRVTTSGHNNTGGTPASYPDIYRGCHWGSCTTGSGLPQRVDQLQNATSSWSITTGAPGTWNAAYDLWYHTDANVNRPPDAAELMIWLEAAGGAGPAGSVVASNVQISGATWNVWQTEFSDWTYIAYVRTSPTSSVSNLDLKAFTQDAVSRGFIQPTWYLSGVEAGFEIWRQGAGLTSNSFSFNP
jgi:hypothetical protein